MLLQGFDVFSNQSFKAHCYDTATGLFACLGAGMVFAFYDFIHAGSVAWVNLFHLMRTLPDIQGANNSLYLLCLYGECVINEAGVGVAMTTDPFVSRHYWL